MIENVLKHNYLGNKSQILYINDLLLKGKFTKDELFKVCSSKEYTYSKSFHGIIQLLLWLNIIKNDIEISLIKELSNKNFLKEFTLLLFSKLSYEKELHNFINNKNIIYNQKLGSIFIKNNLIPLKFSALRNLLMNIELFGQDNLINNQFIINREFSQCFIDIIIPLIEKSQLNNVSLEDLELLHNKKKEIGFEAELFVLEYEKRIRINHYKNKNIKIVSELDVSAGYDILSYQTDDSILLDKFIEVKSFSGEESFFWSRNEIDVAKIKENEYFLYLVDRSKMNNENYIPTIIQNPYENVLNKDNWKKRIEKYFVTV